MSEQTTPSTPQPRRPIIDMVQNIRTRVFTASPQTQTASGQQGFGLGIAQRFTRTQAAPGSAQLTGSQDFLIGLGVGALAVVVVGALTFEIWAPKVAARLARSAGKGLIGGLGGTAGGGILGLGILSIGQAGGRAGRGQILSGTVGAGKIIEKIPRPLKGLYR